jgi:hypothetical protein
VRTLFLEAMMIPVFEPKQRRPLLMSGAHGAKAVMVTPQMVKEAYRNSKGRPIPILPGHHERVDSVRALGTVIADELAVNYRDENGVVHDVAILGHTERLNGQGEHALVEAEFQYYSPYLKRDSTAGWVIEHEGWTNLPRQQGLPPLAFGDTAEQEMIPGPQGRVALSDQGETMGFTEEQKQELNSLISAGVAEALKPVNDEIGKVKEQTAALADTDNTPPQGDNSDDQRFAELERKLALSEARAASGEYVAKYKGKVPDSYLPILGAIRQQLALSDGKIALADGKEAHVVALADQLAEEIARNAQQAESMSLTKLPLSDGDGDGGKNSYERGREAARNA